MKLRAGSLKMNKTDRASARFIKRNREKAQINKTRSEKEHADYNTTDIQRTTRDYYKQVYINKMDNLEEMDTFLEMYNFLRLKKEEIENINRPIISNEV